MSRVFCSAVIGLGLAAVASGCMMPMYKQPHGFSSTYRRYLFGGDPRGTAVWQDVESQKGDDPSASKPSSAADGNIPEIPIPPNAPNSPTAPSIRPKEPGVSQPGVLPNPDAAPVDGNRPTAKGAQLQQSAQTVPKDDSRADLRLTSDSGDVTSAADDAKSAAAADDAADIPSELETEPLQPVIWSNTPVMIR